MALADHSFGGRFGFREIAPFDSTMPLPFSADYCTMLHLFVLDRNMMEDGTFAVQYVLYALPFDKLDQYMAGSRFDQTPRKNSAYLTCLHDTCMAVYM